MATWAKGIDFKNSANTKRLGGVGIYGTDATAQKVYLGFGAEPWNSQGLEMTSSTIKFRGTDISLSNHNHDSTYFKKSGGTVTGATTFNDSVWVSNWLEVIGSSTFQGNVNFEGDTLFSETPEVIVGSTKYNVYHAGKNIDLSANKYIHIPNGSKQVLGVTNAISGGGDKADASDANLRFHSWYGVGFTPTVSGQMIAKGDNAVYINVRNGDLTARGTVYTGCTRIEAPYDPALYIRSTTGDANREGRIIFENADKQQAVQLRYNCYDSVKAPFGLHLERASSNIQTSNGVYFKVDGNIESTATSTFGKGTKETLFGHDVAGADAGIRTWKANIVLEANHCVWMKANNNYDGVNDVHFDKNKGASQMWLETSNYPRYRWSNSGEPQWGVAQWSGTYHLITEHHLSSRMLRFQQETVVMNGSGGYVDPWNGMACSIKGHGCFAVNDRMKAWNGFITGTYSMGKEKVAKADNEYMYEQLKNINVYSFMRKNIDAPQTISDEEIADIKSHSSLTDEERDELFNKDKKRFVDVVNYGVFASELPFEVVNYSPDDEDENVTEMLSYVSMLTGSMQHLIEGYETKIEEYDSKIEEYDFKFEKIMTILESMGVDTNGII